MSEPNGQSLAAARQAGLYFGGGWHCAEAVAKAVLEAMGEDAREAAACATPFGGGVGKSFSEICGAVTGGLVAIGKLHGRREPGQSWDFPAELGAELRARMVERYGTVHCGQLRERFGKEAQMEECRKLVRAVAAEAMDLLE